MSCDESDDDELRAKLMVVSTKAFAESRMGVILPRAMDFLVTFEAECGAITSVAVPTVERCRELMLELAPPRLRVHALDPDEEEAVRLYLSGEGCTPNVTLH